MRARFTNESVESILKPVSGDEIRNKFKECILTIYPDFNERAQKLLDVLTINNFYAPIMNDLESSREYENTSNEDKMMAVVNGFMTLKKAKEGKGSLKIPLATDVGTGLKV